MLRQAEGQSTGLSHVTRQHSNRQQQIERGSSSVKAEIEGSTAVSPLHAVPVDLRARILLVQYLSR